MALTDTQMHNNLIFSKGNIQVSPQHLQILNARPPKPFIPSGRNTVDLSTGYKIFLTGYAEYILSREVNIYAQFVLEKYIYQLKSDPRSINSSYQMKNTIDTRMVSSGKYNIWYKIVSGQVLVFNIELQNQAQLARDRLEKPGLYLIRKNGEGNWQRSHAETTIKTDYAAVNGMLNNLNKATWLMGAHLDAEFGKSKMKEFTLFHNPSNGIVSDLWESARDKFGFTTDVTRKFSNVLQESQKQGKEIKWVAHSQGGAIFAEAVRYYLNGNSSWAIFGGFNGIFKDKKDIDLSNHKVVFHANVNNNFRSSFLFERAGIEVLDAHANDYDLIYNIFGLNSSSPMKWLGSAAYFYPHVIKGTVQQSPHTLPQSQKEWEKNMDNGPGSGRNAIQQGFEAVNSVVQTGVRYIQNFLK